MSLKQTNLTQRLILIFLILVLMTGCSIHIDTSSQAGKLTPLYLPSKVKEMQLVEVKFDVQVRSGIAEGAIIALDVLDDITGFGYNVMRYELNQVQKGNYQTTILLPEYGEVFYRYVQVGSNILPEATINGKAIQYRAVLPSKNLIIKDTVQTWEGAMAAPPLGNLNGVITEAETDMPLSDVVLVIGGQQFISDGNGLFSLEDVPVGVHNLVVLPVDGSHQVFQQEVNIVDKLATSAVIKLQKLPEVKATFRVTPPDDAVGAPIRLMGNFYQLGNSYFHLSEGKSIPASSAPVLEKDEKGNYFLTLTLHAGNDLRYKYTLGNGYLNAEQNADSMKSIRRFIVPNSDFEIKDTILTWRTNNAEPLSMTVSAPWNTPTSDSLSIQFKNESWDHPIPLWPMGANQWLYLFFNDPANIESKEFRFCRNLDCSLSYDLDSTNTPRTLILNENQPLELTIKGWQSLPTELMMDETEYIQPVSGQMTGVEIVQMGERMPITRINQTFLDLKNRGVDYVILTPSNRVDLVKNMPYIHPVWAETDSYAYLADLAEAAKTAGLKIGLYPRLNFGTDMETWWKATNRSPLWWQQWYAMYDNFIIGYARFAQTNGLDQLIYGGPEINRFLPGGIPGSQENPGTPDTAYLTWNLLAEKISKTFQGEKIWAMQVGSGSFPSLEFFKDHIDCFYLQFNRTAQQNYSYDSVTKYIDSVVMSFRDTYRKSFYVGLNAASLISFESSEPDYSRIYRPGNEKYGPDNVDLNAQTYFYSVYLSVLRERDWIRGVVSRGYLPNLALIDYSSSINGKPSQKLFMKTYLIQ